MQGHSIMQLQSEHAARLQLEQAARTASTLWQEPERLAKWLDGLTQDPFISDAVLFNEKGVAIAHSQNTLWYADQLAEPMGMAGVSKLKTPLITEVKPTLATSAASVANAESVTEPSVSEHNVTTDAASANTEQPHTAIQGYLRITYRLAQANQSADGFISQLMQQLNVMILLAMLITWLVGRSLMRAEVMAKLKKLAHLDN